MSNDNINDALVKWAWEALWNPTKPYYLPKVLLNGLQSDKIKVDPLGNLLIAELDLPNMLDKMPWGKVSVDLTRSTLTGVNTMAPDPDADSSFTYDHTTDAFTAKLKFSTLNLSGHYTAKTGGLLGCAVDIAAISGGMKDPTKPTMLGAGDGEVPPLTSAQNYRDKLLQSDQGALTVQTYYENNDTYAELFQYKAFAQVWKEHTTSGRTTSYYGDQTNTAVQPGNTSSVSVNGAPDSQGQSAYNAHSFFMQNFLMSYCYKAADYFGRTTEKGQRYSKAGNDAATFGVNVKPQSAQPMTADAVMTAVTTVPPRSSSPAANGRMMFIEAGDPQWLRDVCETAEAKAHAAAAADLGSAPSPRLGDTGIPIEGDYSDTFATPTLKLTGTITFEGTTATAAFSNIEGSLGPIQITLYPPLSVYDTSLFTSLQQSIANTDWVKGMLASAVKSQLNSEDVRKKIAEVMNLALAKALG